MIHQYTIKELFRTIQGEGFHAGTPAIFIRFAGCNMWSGRNVDRERDAVRNEAECPRWCDTDFVGGMRKTAAELHALIGNMDPVPLIVLTGGEPMLQVDDRLLDALIDAAPEARIAIETNGTVKPKFDDYEALARADNSKVWVTLSPKRSRADTVLTCASELKLVWPAYKPSDWVDFPASHYYLQPCAAQTIRQEAVERECAKVITANYRWKLSLQQHKILGVR